MSSLIKLGETLLKSGPVKTDTTPRRVRGLFGGEWIFDTLSAVYVWEWVGCAFSRLSFCILPLAVLSSVLLLLGGGWI